MREILFRAKRADNGGWEYGQLKSIHKGGKNYETAYYILNIYGESRLAKDAIDPNTIGQFTGLCDKNGEKVFEGDIVRTESSTLIVKNGITKISCCGCCYDYHDYIGFYFESLNGEVDMYEEITKGIEVVGNIHDNPELLEGI